MPELVTPGEIAKRFGVTPSAVSHWIKRSNLGSLRPRFPRPVHESQTRKLWSWADVTRWGEKWMEFHPGSLPGLRPDYEAQALADAADIRADYPLSKTLKGGCTCPPGAISLHCPVHT